MDFNTSRRPRAPASVRLPDQPPQNAAVGAIPLSVIITCFNYATFVRQAINSVLSQGLEDVEVIVVDDGSTDASWALISACGDRIKAIQTQRLGPLGASLAGFAISSGRYVYFLDADDLLCDGAMHHLAKYLDDQVSKIQFMLTPIDEDGKVIGPPFPRLDDAHDSKALIHSIKARGHYSTPPTSGNIYRRDVYEDLGDLDYERAIDGLPYLLAPFVGKVISIAQPLGMYRIHGRNVSSFSALTPARMAGYADRFMGRLSHLETMLRLRGLDDGGFHVHAVYSYVLEMDLLRQIAEGRRIRLNSLASFIGLAWREERSTRAVLFILFYCCLFMVPHRQALDLVRFRLDQSINARVRGWLKQMLGMV